jgi:hypothetical protein
VHPNAGGDRQPERDGEALFGTAIAAGRHASYSDDGSDKRGYDKCREARFRGYAVIVAVSKSHDLGPTPHTARGNVSSKRCAGKDECGDYNAGAVEYAYQCAGERYALSMAEATTAPPNMVTLSVIAKANIFIMTLPRLDRRDPRLLELRARSWFLSVS